MFMTQPVLVVLDLDKEMRIEANMLEYMTREVLFMKSEDEK